MQLLPLFFLPLCTLHRLRGGVSANFNSIAVILDIVNCCAARRMHHYRRFCTEVGPYFHTGGFHQRGLGGLPPLGNRDSGVTAEDDRHEGGERGRARERSKVSKETRWVPEKI